MRVSFGNEIFGDQAMMTRISWNSLSYNNYLPLKWLTTISYIISGFILVFGLNKAGIFGFLFSHFMLLCIFYKLRDVRLVMQYFFFCVFDFALINYWFFQ